MSKACKAVFQNWILALGVMSLTACGGTEALDETQEKQTVQADPQTCYQEARAEYGESAALSCLYQAPVDEQGNSAGSLAASQVEAMAVNCEDPANYRDYHGPCTSWGGCSVATGEGYSHTACGSWLYAWLRICDGRPVGWGYGACAW